MGSKALLCALPGIILILWDLRYLVGPFPGDFSGISGVELILAPSFVHFLCIFSNSFVLLACFLRWFVPFVLLLACCLCLTFVVVVVCTMDPARVIQDLGALTDGEL